MQIRVILLLLIFSESVFGRVARNAAIPSTSDNNLNSWNFKELSRNKRSDEQEGEDNEHWKINKKINTDASIPYNKEYGLYSYESDETNSQVRNNKSELEDIRRDGNDNINNELDSESVQPESSQLIIKNKSTCIVKKITCIVKKIICIFKKIFCFPKYIIGLLFKKICCLLNFFKNIICKIKKIPCCILKFLKKFTITAQKKNIDFLPKNI